MEKIKRTIKNPIDFDPDEFILEKDDVLQFIQVVISYWMRDKKHAEKNVTLIGGLEMMKAGIVFTDEKDFRIIWSMLISFVLEMMYENQIQKSLNNGESWAKTIKKLKREFNEEKLEKMFARYQK